MAGSITLGGMSDNLVIGKLTIGPSTMSGKQNIGNVVSLELEANVDTRVTVPPEAVAFAVEFTFSGSPGPEVKLRTNANESDAGYPLIAQGWGAMPIASGVTTLIFHAASAPKVFQITFI